MSSESATFAPPLTSDAVISPRLLRRFQPLPAVFENHGHEGSAETIALGRVLFYDGRLAADGETSCNSCHDLGGYGVDGRRFSIGAGGAVGGRNAPSVFNAAGQFAQFWDGRSDDVESQAKGPILHPREMAMADGAAVVKKLSSIPGYVDAFARAFPESAEPITFDNVAVAIGAFERGLTTPGRWDSYLRGDTKALTEKERRGLQTFLNVGCMVCHTGPLVGGSMFERVGVVEPWPNRTDLGRAAVTKAASDEMSFKVPSLRNVARTAPYFHDGSAPTLPIAVSMMGKHQLGLDLTTPEVESIVSWLESLTGFASPEYISRPELPR